MANYTAADVPPRMRAVWERFEEATAALARLSGQGDPPPPSAP